MEKIPVGDSRVLSARRASFYGRLIEATLMVKNEGPNAAMNSVLRMRLPVELECGSQVPAGSCPRLFIANAPVFSKTRTPLQCSHAQPVYFPNPLGPPFDILTVLHPHPIPILLTSFYICTCISIFHCLPHIHLGMFRRNCF